jgi:hypothetical protein
MEKNYIPESNQISAPIPMNNIKRYLKKEDAICKFITNEGRPLGTGFFCQTTIKNNTIKFLFTCNHVLDKLKIQIDSRIQLKHQDTTKNIEITKNRFVCTNEELDYTCIEILDDDNFDNYFKIDSDIDCDNPFEQYKDDKIGILQCPGEEDVSIAEGKIVDIKNNSSIIHSVSTDLGSSGSPIILSTRNLNIIGIHLGKIEAKNNKGVYFKIVLEDLEKKYLRFLENKPIGTYEYERKILDKYSLEQYKKNNEKW